MCSLPSFISDFPGKGLGGEEGEEWAGRLVHPPEDAENESQEIALQKRKDRRRFSSLDSKRRRGGWGEWNLPANLQSSLHQLPPTPPTAGTKDVVLVSCHSARGSLIKQTSRCHRSLGRVRSATAWLPPQTPAPGAPDLITQELLRPQPWRRSRARLRFPRTERAGGAPASLSAGAPQPDAR